MLVDTSYRCTWIDAATGDALGCGSVLHAAEDLGLNSVDDSIADLSSWLAEVCPGSMVAQVESAIGLPTSPDPSLEHRWTRALREALDSHQLPVVLALVADQNDAVAAVLAGLTQSPEDLDDTAPSLPSVADASPDDTVPTLTAVAEERTDDTAPTLVAVADEPPTEPVAPTPPVPPTEPEPEPEAAPPPPPRRTASRLVGALIGLVGMASGAWVATKVLPDAPPPQANAPAAVAPAPLPEPPPPPPEPAKPGPEPTVEPAPEPAPVELAPTPAPQPPPAEPEPTAGGPPITLPTPALTKARQAQCEGNASASRWPCRRKYARPKGCPELGPGIVGFWWAGPEHPGKVGEIVQLDKGVHVRCDLPRPDNNWDYKTPVASTLSAGHWVRISGDAVKVRQSWFVPLHEADYPIPR